MSLWLKSLYVYCALDLDKRLLNKYDSMELFGFFCHQLYVCQNMNEYVTKLMASNVY